MLTLKQWTRDKVVKWRGIRNSDTKTIDGGYLFVRNDDGTVEGLGTRRVSNRKEAIEYHYGQYVEEQTKPQGEVHAQPSNV